MRTFQFEHDGEAVEREEFVAKRIGHDLARTNYQVDRAHRSAPGTERDPKAAQTAIVPEAEAARAGSSVLGI